MSGDFSWKPNFVPSAKSSNPSANSIKREKTDPNYALHAKPVITAIVGLITLPTVKSDSNKQVAINVNTLSKYAKLDADTMQGIAIDGWKVSVAIIKPILKKCGLNAALIGFANPLNAGGRTIKSEIGKTIVFGIKTILIRLLPKRIAVEFASARALAISPLRNGQT